MKTKLIFIEAESISGNNIVTGIGRVITNYISKIMEMNTEDYKFQIVSLNHNNLALDGIKHCQKNEMIRSNNSTDNFFMSRFYKNYWRIHSSAPTVSIFIYRIYLTILLFRNRPDLLIQTSPYISPIILPSRVKYLVFVYDYVWLHYKNLMNSFQFLSQRIMKKSIQKSDAIITISDFIKHETEIYFNKTNVFSIKLAADPSTFTMTDNLETYSIISKYNIPKPYILSVCTLEPRKNLSVLIDAYASLINRNMYNLVLTGMSGWKNEELFKTIKDHDIVEDVILTGYVPDNDLKGLYTGALLFVFPSLYEGFGLPVLEAMQCGCPVIVSNASSLPEVVGDAGIVLSPTDIDGFRQAIENICSNPLLRLNLRNMGLQKSTEFSWDKSFKLLLSIINSMLK